VKKIIDRLGIGRSATYDRVNRALAAGFLANRAKKNERNSKIALGAELPTGGPFLPTPDDVFVRVMSGSPTGQTNGSTMLCSVPSGRLRPVGGRECGAATG
jgi:hypothetical protein